MRTHIIRKGAAGFIVYELKSICGGKCWNDTGRRFDTKEAAQEFIDKERGKRNAQKE